MVLKILSVLLFFAAAAFAVFLTLNNSKKVVFNPSVGQPPPRSIYLGAWVSNFWDNNQKKLTAQNLINFEELIDKKVALANMYSEWEFLKNPRLLMALNEISANGWTPIISANPSFIKGCTETSESIYKAIAQGSCDEYLTETARNLKSFNKPIFLRFAWEMNLPNMYWSIEKTHSKPQDFVDAWRHMHDIFRMEQANNIVWVLSFNTSSKNTVPYKDLFPGDKYVDWVAIDGYNWGTSQSWSGWTSFSGVFRISYKELTALTSKPVMLSEVNTSPDGGDKAKWLADMLDVQLPNEFRKVEAIVFFNEDKTAGESVDWRLEKSNGYVSVVKKSLKNDIYKSSYR